MNDKKRVVLNVLSGVIFKIIILILGLISTRFVLSHLGKEINGLLALFTSVIGFLSIAELGVGTAITFSMYKPIFDKDYDKLSALYYLFRKVYLILMAIIFVVGISISFFIPRLATGYNQDYSIVYTYILFLLSIVLTYTYAHKTSTINAFKDNYITTLITSILKILELLGQVIVLILTKNFILFLIVRILISLLDYIVTSIIFNKKYKYYLTSNKEINITDKKIIMDNIKGMFLIRIGAVLILSTDNLIISKFVNVGELGRYSVYSTIITSMSGLLSLVFLEITSILGHKNISISKEERVNLFYNLYYINIVMSFIFFIGYFATANSLIHILFSGELIYVGYMVAIITMTFVSDFNRRSLAVTKTSLGLFHEERIRPIIEGLVNLILSLVLVQFFGVAGVLISTIITRLFVLYTIEPYIVFKHGFNKKANKFYILQYLIFGIQIITIFILSKLMVVFESPFKSFLINGMISILFSISLLIVLTLTIPPFKQSFKNILLQAKNLIRKQSDI